MTYELVHFADVHTDEIFRFRGIDVTGARAGDRIRAELIERLTGQAASLQRGLHHQWYRLTTATIITASLGITDMSQLIRGGRSRRSNGPTCSSPCSTHYSLACSHSRDGICAGCLRWNV